MQTTLTEEKYKNRESGELMPVAIFELNGMSDLYFPKSDYENYPGGYKGILKDFGFKPGDLVKIHKINIHPWEFPTSEWEG